ncbi:CbtB-domain containing protein [Halobaculum sp. CBA1158]|uniref:CbtB domain-containing protein n=1 Tax=Halobaculum sp. CBA1158 TaxID=2904243 RepID=UPI001F3A4762|nr:CbtB domain-containing protein [Halobaculum sp. CBA1158]UIO99832.1 CbtB-domain containing protein [Halobaculum sp. CBA1158]
MTTADTVHDRWELARTNLTAAQAATAALTVAALGFAMLFLQEPAAHEAMHNFRHAAGIVCH